MQHIITCLVENNPGVLARISGMFSQRGFNIDSLNVGTALDPTTSRMTIVTSGDDNVIGQIIKQLNKLVDVIEVQDVTEDAHVERELVLIKIGCDDVTRSQIIQIVDIYRARIVDVDLESLVIELVGSKTKIEGLVNLLQSFAILQLSRTGAIAMPRGKTAAGHNSGNDD